MRTGGGSGDPLFINQKSSVNYAQVQNERVWQTAWAEIIQDKATPQAAAEKAFKRVEEIFAKFPIPQT